MLVVDASCLFEVVADTPAAEVIRARLAAEPDQAAPHVIDVEVLNIVRMHRLAGRLERTAAQQAIDDLRTWPGERYGHRALLDRVWDLRDNVRGWDAFYVALAEALDAPLLTLDRRLRRARGPRCAIEVPVSR
jgi:predicted nucleic acid-binding protein